MSANRFFKAFDHYLSGIAPGDAANSTTFVHQCLRDEYQSYSAERSGAARQSLNETQPIVSILVGMLIMSALFTPVAVALYFSLR